MALRLLLSSALFAAVISLPAFAQDTAEQTQPTIQDQFPRDIVYSAEDKVLTLVVENDLFGGNGEDENYTSGLRLGYFDINADMPELAYELDKFIPTFEINETTSVFYSLGHNIYTPSDIEKREQDPNDRPWAAHLYGSMGLVSITDNHIDEIELSLGVVGPAALGEQAQKLVHSHITTQSPTPKGWSNQLKNEPAINVGWQRRFPQAWNRSVGGISLAATPYYGVALGNVYSFADAGFNLRLTPESERWQDAPARVRPGLPGTGFFEIPKKGWSWYLFAGAEGRAVARNIFLDGNTFQDSHRVDKKYFVADLNAGLAITYDQYRLSYTLVKRTKEFEGQDDDTVFGALSLGYRF